MNISDCLEIENCILKFIWTLDDLFLVTYLFGNSRADTRTMSRQ